MRPLVLVAAAFVALPLPAADPPAVSAVEDDILAHLAAAEPELVKCNQDIWAYAELGLEEHRSAARLVGLLKAAGFKVEEGVSGMPTAFVAESGSGKPVIGILAEYDALPDLSQEAAGGRKPALGRANGHGCGHSALGTAAVGAAAAVKAAMEKHKLPGTLRVYGTPAEETLIGKVYMALDGRFDDLDACLHWHPGSKNRVWPGSSKAMVSAKFTFTGLPAHASGSPDKGRSALDGVELMNVGVNYMREHVKESTRVHYVITKGGGQPNVVPASAQVWYFVRGNTHEDAGKVFDWVKEIADGAARMSRTKVAVAIDTDCHEIIPNDPLAGVLHRNLTRVGPPKFTDADRALARELQAPLRGEFGLKEEKPLHEVIDPLPTTPPPPDGGSTDVGDVSWKVPTSGLNTACFPLGSPGHSWQNVAAIGSPLGHKGMMTASKALALSLADLLRDPAVLKAARADFENRTAGRAYTTRIPKGQKPPATIR
jgi:aminobenzoyl-glutamate utilization protein B